MDIFIWQTYVKNWEVRINKEGFPDIPVWKVTIPMRPLPSTTGLPASSYKTYKFYFSKISFTPVQVFCHGPSQGQIGNPKLGMKHTAQLGASLASRDPIGL